MVVLGIETTCDETAAAVVERPERGPGKILSNIVLSQISEHAAFGGVVPEIAARAHVEALDLIIARAMSEAGRSFDAARRRRGRGRARADRRRHRRAHHRQGDRAGDRAAADRGQSSRSPRAHGPAHRRHRRFPYCLFLASGGHTQIVAVRGVGDYVRLGTTIDDAIGEAFDKTAKLLGLAYPGGPQVEKEALDGNPARFALPRPMLGKPNADFSLSGLKTALRLEAEKIAPISEQDVRDLCASFQQAVVDVVADRLRCGLKMFREQFGTPTALVAAGGVAANEAIRKVLQAGRVRGRHHAGGAARRAVHRQRRHDRLGGRRAAGARAARHARHRAARALAARRCARAAARPTDPPLRAGRGAAAAQARPSQPDRRGAMGLERIAIVGAGAWGTALANALARAGRSVTLVGRDQASADAMARSRASPRLPGTRIDDAGRGGGDRRRRPVGAGRDPAGGARRNICATPPAGWRRCSAPACR